jgi:integrase
MTKPKRTSERQRAARGRGSVYFRERDQLWVGELSRTDEDGRRERRYVTGRDQDEVHDRLDALRMSWKGSPTVRRDGSMTLGRHLDGWLRDMKPRVAANTWLGREQHVRVHLGPALGTKRLDRLSVRDVEKLLADIVEQKHRSARTASHVRVTLRIALGVAQRDGLVQQNVASLAKGPKVPSKEMRTLAAESVKRLLAVTSKEDDAALWLVSITTGIRAGELAGLEWDDIDLGDGALHVRRSWARRLDGSFGPKDPKTEKSKRTIPLTPETVEALSHLRTRQAVLGQAAGTDPVFTDPAGDRIDTTKLAPRLRALLKQAGLSTELRFHDLRHSAATLWLGHGVDVKTVADLLGHSTPVITMTVYAHSDDKRKQDAVERLREAITSG